MHPNDAPDFTFRIRFRIPCGHRIGIEDTDVAIETTSGRHIILRSGDRDKKINESEWLIVQSSGWDSEERAEDAAEHFTDALRRTLVRHGLGVDLGNRGLRGGEFSPAALQGFREQHGIRVLNEIHGVSVYATEPRPVFGALHATGAWPPVKEESLRKTLSFALECQEPLNHQERIAFDLFSAARDARTSEDAYFVLLFVAIETLLEERPRPAPVIDHVNRLIEMTKNSSLDNTEKNLLVGSLQWLRSHSIRNSGRCFVRERLANREYQGQSAEHFFLRCYDLRNRLVHGGEPFPTPTEIRQCVSGLDTMVSHLLSGPLLNFDIA